MSTEFKIRTALSEALKTRGRQAEISKALNVHPSTVKRWAEGSELTAPVLTLLDWYFFGVMPAKLDRPLDARATLDFDAGEWNVIGAMARREGVTEAVWIARRIRDYLELLQDKDAELKVEDKEQPYGQMGNGA